jgi:hypothetical protein
LFLVFHIYIDNPFCYCFFVSFVIASDATVRIGRSIMKGLWKLVAVVTASLGVFGGAGGARAQTVLTSSITAGTSYTYGDTTFKFTSCSYGGMTSCGALELLGVSNGRGGTEIEVEVNPSVQSYIFTNGSNQTGSFTLSVGTLAGSHGISSVTNIVGGYDAGNTSNDSKVTSVLSAITVVKQSAIGGGSLTSQLNETPVAAVTWPIQTAAFSITDTLALSSAGVTGVNSLQLRNVRLLFTPAPEPASIAVLGAGLMGLAAARRRSGRRRVAE